MVQPMGGERGQREEGRKTNEEIGLGSDEKACVKSKYKHTHTNSQRQSGLSIRRKEKRLIGD